MPITNEDIAQTLNNIADALEEQEDNPYRIKAYRRAANSLKRYPQSVVELLKQKGDLTIIPRVGENLAKLITEIIVTGNLAILPQHNPARPYPAHLINKKRKPGEFKIYSVMVPLARMLTRLKAIPGIQRVEFAGNYRRKKDVVSDLDILIVTDHAKTVFEKFHAFPSIKFIVKTEANFTLVQLKSGLRITLHNVKEDAFGARLIEATGSSKHYEALQKRVRKLKLRLTSTGLFKEKKRMAVSEVEIYEALKLEYIPPELRENRGEIEAAVKNSLPTLVELADIKGDLHTHTNETDGSFTLEEMVEAAYSHGYEYVAITDHSQSLKITNGLDEKRLLKQIKQIDRLNEKYSNFTILKSMEVDILEDGSLDLSDAVLKELDLTVCSVHSKFRLSREKQTERILRAMDNPYFNVLGHATGRLLYHRPPYEVDIERILQGAKERNCFMEVNAQPARLDINDVYCKMAKDMGVKVAISSDAHTTNGFNFMILGVNQARRGWLEAGDVINTYKLMQLKKILKR